LTAWYVVNGEIITLERLRGKLKKWRAGRTNACFEDMIDRKLQMAAAKRDAWT
jgi:hypothetical protein